MKFLDGPSAEAAIKKILSSAKRARVAVAYWGEGAVRRLGIATGTATDIEIVCDARHGGCNPYEIRRLRTILGRKRVLTCDNLHAKVWLTDKAAVIGSSNASANGLGYEGDETLGLIEANVLIEDRDTLEKIEKWFDQTVRPSARPVSDDDLKRATPEWKHRRSGRSFPNGSSVWELIQQNPGSFSSRNFLVWIWPHEESDDWADQLAAEQKITRHNDKIDFYQDATAPAGAYILDFDSSRGRTKQNGLYKVLTDHPVVRNSRKGTILLCTPARTFQGLKLGSRSDWELAATRAAKSNRKSTWEGNIESFAKRFIG